VSNDNNKPKTASEMLFHELAANNGTKRDIVDRLMLKPPLHSLTNTDLCEAAQEIRDLRETVNELTAWSEGVEADNDTLRKEIARLREERDAARRDFCNASYDDPHLVARERGWDCFKNEKQHTYICDHCGETTDSDNAFHYAELPQDIASANKGESATLCRKCDKMIEANANNQDFRTTDMG
jgi:hypothetical protein